MKKVFLFLFTTILLACNQPTTQNTNTTNQEESNKSEEKNTTKKSDLSISMMSLFELSPLSIFDETTDGLSLSEKNDLIKNGKSTAWNLINKSNSRLSIQNQDKSSEVNFHFFKNKNNSDGLFFASILNGQNNQLLAWKYDNAQNTLQATDPLKKYSANDFVSKEDQLPDSFKSTVHYQFVDDQKIEVLLHTWMVEELENREIINKIFLKWNGENFTEEIISNELWQANFAFKSLDQTKYPTAQLNHEGKIVFKKFWQDSNGENIVLFTQKELELYVYHYSVKDDQVKLLRKIYDFEEKCEFDLTLEFLEKSIGVTDLDKNNIGEITFAYQKSCRSDVSPLVLKLLILENGEKYILRGNTIVDLGDQKIGGDKKMDASFDQAPMVFLDHANKVWGSINK